MQSLTWRWPAAILVIVIALATIQLIRVNQPRDSTAAEPPRVYTSAGAVVKGQVTIRAGDFYSNRIDLNRRSKLIGSFITTDVRTSRVSVLVMDEKEFESWRSGGEFRTLAQTGYVPGGKINLALEPGVFFLVVDNQQSDIERPVHLDFSLER